ncbi:hypothetical protein IFR05_002515 [Cadophora sp. M221]|nr:hypothetical protein IFR05_002515 [Cadophora sp. M221]
MVGFLAETLDLPMLPGQVVSMLRRNEYTQSGAPKPLPTHVEIYERTKPGNAMRRFVVEAYIHDELAKNKPAVLSRHLREREQGFDERLANAAEEIKKNMTRRCDALVASAMNDANASRSGALQAKLAAVSASKELETLKKAHVQSLEVNDRRHDELLTIMKARNQEHLNAVADMERVTEGRETRLKTELADLRTIKQKYDLQVVEAISDADEIRRLKAELSKQEELAEGWIENEELTSGKIEELESQISEQRISTKVSEDAREILWRRVRELEAQISEQRMSTIVSKGAKDILSRRVEELQAERSRQISSVKTSKQNEENLSRQMDVLQNTKDVLEENAGQQKFSSSS